MQRTLISRGPRRAPRAPPLFFFLVRIFSILRTSKIKILMIPRKIYFQKVFFSMFCYAYEAYAIAGRIADDTVFQRLWHFQILR